MGVSRMEFTQDVQKGIEKVFIAFEIALGPLSVLELSYEEWDGEMYDHTVFVRLKGETGDAKPVQDYEAMASASLLETANRVLEDVLRQGLEETPSRDETVGSRGSITVERVSCNLQVSWSHTDIFSVEYEDGSAAMDRDRWEQFRTFAKRLKAQTIVIEYRGGGDSMDGADYSFTDKNGNTLQVSSDSNIFKELDGFFDTLMMGPVNGFWDNEGGHGEIKITEVEEDSYWNHWNYGNEDETTASTFEMLSIPPKQVPEGDLIEAMSDPVWG